MFSSLLKISAFSIALFSLQSAYAQDTDARHLVVKLDSIKKLTAQEDQGDELYFSVTEYSSTKDTDHYQVPSFPTHWLSSYLEQVKNVNLWEKSLAKDESVQLIISLVERDVPPWNVDDLIGSVKLKAKFEDGHLKQEWSIPNQHNTTRVPQSEDAFKFFGDEAQYRIVFKIEEGKAPQTNKPAEELD